jgi:DNA polymerase elongation subunit (family B)
MYPLLGMVGFNMSPETFVPKHKLPDDLHDVVLAFFNGQDEYKVLDLGDDVWDTVTGLLQKYNFALGINGAVFKKDKLGIIPDMVQEIYDSRKKAKNQMFAYEQRKILIERIIKERASQNRQ